MMDFKNKLIVAEGCDNTGKTSIMKHLNKYLNEHEIKSVFTFQPGDTAYGTQAALIRSLCKDKRYELCSLSNFFAFQLDRSEQISKIVAPALADGYTVISDRWSYSTYAYQLYGEQLIKKLNMPESVAEWLLTSANMCREPDIVFYFPERLKNKRDNDPNDKFDAETEEYFNRVNNAYKKLAEKYNWIEIYPENTELETFEKILKLS